MRAVTFCLAVLAIVAPACHKSGTTTSPSSTSTTTTVASPTTTDSFDGTLPVGGTSFFTFAVGEYGTVNATLVSVGGAGVPSTVQVRVGIGTITETSCTPSVTSIAKAGSASQLSTLEQPGTYCVNVTDVGNLFAPADFTLTVAHP